jgi:FtsP/CotA-like multicopper oxidase with cupredoxin domain
VIYHCQTQGHGPPPHTIHWHGIEPTPMNDGVGHTSFEATANFVYQFATNTAGTYFYHCHKNTVLHFEMGLYGLLLVDPPNPGGPAAVAAGTEPAAPYFGPKQPGVPLGFVRANVPGFPGFDPAAFTIPYDVEAPWVPDEFDSIWHELGHEAFMQHCDANNPNAAANFTQDGFLNNHIPDIFFVSGVISEVASGNLNNLPIILAPIRTAPVSPTVQVGETLLVRLLDAGYTTQEYTFGTAADRPSLNAMVIATDGHPFGIPGTDDQYSSPFVITAGTPFRLTTARRLDLLLRPTQRGEYLFTIKHIDFVKSKSANLPNDELVWAIQQVAINVVP